MSPQPPGGLERVLDWLDADPAGALAALGFPLYVIDTDGVIRWLNAAATDVVGDAVGRPFVELLAPQATTRARSEFAAKLMRTKTRTDFDIEVTTEDGREVRAEVSSVPLVDRSEVVGVFGVAHPVGAATEPGTQLEQLTPRQREVLDLLGRGRTTREMADELGVAEETVRNHVRHLLKRLGARSRLSAVLQARRHGLAGD